MRPLIEQKKILETWGNSRPLLVYSRKKQTLNGDKPKSLQGQESEPIPSPDEQADNYTHHDGTDHSIQKGTENLTEDVDLDLPIALRKGTRTCTQHPISKFVSCEKLSPIFREFELKDLGALRYFLGMEVARSKSGITVSQRKYVLDLLRDTGMLGCRPAETPMEPNAKLDIEGGKDVDREQYQRLVGKLIYLSHTRPDIAFDVSVISQFMHSPKKKHLDAVYGVLRYLKGTPGKGLFFKKENDRMVEIYTDADWAGSSVDRRSISGYCTYVWGNLVTWRSKKQPVVARSSAEAEFRALAHGNTKSKGKFIPIKDIDKIDVQGLTYQNRDGCIYWCQQIDRLIPLQSYIGPKPVVPIIANTHQFKISLDSATVNLQTMNFNKFANLTSSRLHRGSPGSKKEIR
ncbi:hypothetical protein RJ639_023205 [Escallonia herrerae]|uniref:Reverse transcriptase Ty1/copia-type domain-containing protein n=1 Tax=Escallonia herrerae TaxID=1293975 RepID=A0AA88V0W2_9ASTE|nr:hypothetical protein RJ639_023205 [Escallonia herrerae]